MNVLFEIYKDKCIGNSEMFRKEITSKYDLTDDEVSELYKRVVNYQVKTYGETLDGKWVEHIDVEKARELARHRRIDRIKRRGLK